MWFDAWDAFLRVGAHPSEYTTLEGRVDIDATTPLVRSAFLNPCIRAWVWCVAVGAMGGKTSWQSKAELPPETTAHLATLWYQAVAWVTSVPPGNRYSQRTHHGCTMTFEAHWTVTPAAPSRIAQPCNAQMAPAPGATRRPYVPTPNCAIAHAGSLTESFLLTHPIASSSSQRLVLCGWVSQP